MFVMKNFKLDLPFRTSGASEYIAPMTVYAPSNGLDLYINKNRPAVVIYPGGGYSFTYDGEAEPIALKFAAAGICAFVVNYSCAPARFPQALVEALEAVRYVREHAEDFGINPNNIATCGFSAGGHLCGCTGTLWNHPCLAEYLQEDRSVYRPDKLILCYPVLKNTGNHHQGSFDNLLGTEEELQTAEMLELTSLEKQVSAQTPPCFLWHTFEDTAVPIDGTLEFSEKLLEVGIPMEIHIFPHGGHGSCLANYVTADMPIDKVHAMAEWIDKAIRFALDESILPAKEEA